MFVFEFLRWNQSFQCFSNLFAAFACLGDFDNIAVSAVSWLAERVKRFVRCHSVCRERTSMISKHRLVSILSFLFVQYLLIRWMSPGLWRTLLIMLEISLALLFASSLLMNPDVIAHY